MRPIHLDVVGFGPFRDRVEVDFAGADLFALTGPTGAGKSSVLDAICFALYGNVPRYDDERLVGRAVSVGAIEAKVSLEFEVGARRYVAHRTVRRSTDGKASTKEARLEELGPDGAVIGRPAGTPREMKIVVPAVLGLPFDQFTKCVALPQGEFAAFLHAKPEHRQNVLARLLGLDVYGTVGQRARELAKVSKAQVEHLQRELDGLAHVTADARAAAARALQDRQAVARDAEAAAERDTTLGGVEQAARARAAGAADLAGRLEALAVPTGVVALAQRLTDAAREWDAATSDDLEARDSADAAQHALEALPRHGELVAASQAHEQLADVREQLVAANQAVDTLTAGEQRAASEARTAGDARAAAEAGLEAVRLAHARDEMSAALVLGDPCPVCHQPVHALPTVVTSAEVEAAKAAVAAAKRAEHALDQEQREAAQHLAAAAERQRGFAHQAEQLLALVHAHPDPSALSRAIDQVEAAEQAAKAARAAQQQTAARLKAASGQRAELDRERKQAAAQLREARDAVVALAPPDADPDDLAGSWEKLESWAHAHAPEQRRIADEANAELTSAAAERSALVRDLTRAASAAGVECPPPGTVTSVRTAIAAGIERADAEMQAIDDALERAAALRVQLDAAAREGALADHLGHLLSASGFEAWLVEEALQTLVAGATDTLRELSQGAYSLILDGQRTKREFAVVDHRNADEVRSVRTLSGGETFQTSLALALALSDHLQQLAAERTPPLEAIFLDEGFGSLDADSLEVVATTIETLGATGRMVGLVTHVRDLAERVPVRFEVAKHDRTSTITRVEG